MKATERALYRGKRLDNGEWVYGYLADEDLILQDDRMEPSVHVDPSTVGQWTGLTDKNGMKIFEGDTVSMYCYWNGNREVSTVRNCEGVFEVTSDLLNREYGYSALGWMINEDVEVEVIGNIHDKTASL